MTVYLCAFYVLAVAAELRLEIITTEQIHSTDNFFLLLLLFLLRLYNRIHINKDVDTCSITFLLGILWLLGSGGWGGGCVGIELLDSVSG